MKQFFKALALLVCVGMASTGFTAASFAAGKVIRKEHTEQKGHKNKDDSGKGKNDNENKDAPKTDGRTATVPAITTAVPPRLNRLRQSRSQQ